jgi:histidyl-tRNA synthetase
VVGSDSLLSEVELMQIIDTVFTRFGIRVSIRINNRKILTGMANYIGQPDKIVEITTAIDKLDKIGIDNVKAELAESGVSAEGIAKLQPLFEISGDNDTQLQAIAKMLSDDEVGTKGVEEVRFVLDALKPLGLKNEIALDLTLARGLNYYTGCIFEVKAVDVQIGSITGGGRYDNLTGIFGMPGLSGVGISFGADRIYDVLNQLDLYPQDAIQGAQVLFINFGQAEAARSMQVATQLRQAGIAVEVYPDSAKMKKQMSYANTLGVPYVALIGESELQSGLVTLKDMQSGQQQQLTAAEVIKIVGTTA